MARRRITETELILPSLYIMALNGGTITTSELIPKLRAIMRPQGEDLEILSGRNDDKFSQKVRNLRAHGTFERYGYAVYKGVARQGYAEITDEGREHLKENEEILKYLLTNDFDYIDLTENLKQVEQDNEEGRKIETFDENIIILEGIKKVKEVAVYERSTKLRNYAIEHFTKDGHIACQCCTFDFQDFYGETGKGFIEIHHTKPIFKYEDEDIEKTLERALSNLAPVCSNCHRMIHRNWSKPLEIQTLINAINENGVFSRFQQ